MPVRELTAADHAALLALWRRAGLTTIRPAGRDAPESFARQLACGTQWVFGHEEDGVLLGAVVATHDGRKGWIQRLAVDPAARRRGIATALLRAAEDHLRAEGMTILAALVLDDNAPSLAFFEQAGYGVREQVRYLSKRDSPDV